MRSSLRFLITFLFFWVAGSAASQIDFECGTVIPREYLEAEKRAMPGYFGCEQVNRVDRKFSVLFQIFRDSSGAVGVSDLQLSEAIDNLNEEFEPIGFTFEFCEKRILDNHQFNHFVFEDHSDDMLAMYYEPNIINMFVSSSIEKQENQLGGYAYFPGSIIIDVIHLSKNVFVPLPGGSPSTIIHEMGHFFGLFHTFETDFGEELVDGSNCATAGDKVCDTEANPSVSGAGFNDNCDYVGQPETDSMGNYFVPPVQNYMSYVPGKCRCDFTKQQYNRMVEQYWQYRTYLW